MGYVLINRGRGRTERGEDERKEGEGTTRRIGETRREKERESKEYRSFHLIK